MEFFFFYKEMDSKNYTVTIESSIFKNTSFHNDYNILQRKNTKVQF